MQKKEPISIAGDYARVIEKYNASVCVENAKMEHVLFIHTPLAAHDIKKIVFNGTEIPVNGVSKLEFSALPGGFCELTVSRIGTMPKQLSANPEEG